MSQKYKQKGYQDSGPKTSSATPGTRGPGFSDDRPARLEGAPKGRGADRDRDEVFRCKACGEKSDIEFGVTAACRKCGAALHSCQQCRYFDGAARFQCLKEIPAPIASKTKFNECALYAPSVTLDLRGRSAQPSPDGARSAFDALFRK